MLRNVHYVQQMRNTLLRTTLTHRFLVFIVFLLVSALLNSQKSETTFRAAVEECEQFTQPLNFDDARKILPKQVSELLLEVDHVFVLGVDSCVTKLPQIFFTRVTCIIGRKLDACAPRRYVRGVHTHAMKVSFTHATVMYLAHKAQHKHIAVIEDDIMIRSNTFSTKLVQEFRVLLDSNAWSIVRFGFRPYFLEKSSRESCPSKCRCEIKKHVYEHFCELSRAGCDIRSSDFYVIHQRPYEHLMLNILDLTQANSKRIIDTRPMRYFAKQWLALPQISIQTNLDIPVDYQIGLGALYVKKCVYPRPLSELVTRQLFVSNVDNN